MMDRLMSCFKSSETALLYNQLSSKTYLKIPRLIWSLLLLTFLIVNVLFIAFCVAIDTSAVLHYRGYDCKYNLESANGHSPTIIEQQSESGASYYYSLNVSLVLDVSGSDVDQTVLNSVIWHEFCMSSTKELAIECLKEHIGSSLDDSFTCYAVQSNVESLVSSRKQSIDGDDISLCFGSDLAGNYVGELSWTIPLAIIAILIVMSFYIVFGFLYFEGRSKFSLDRFIRQVIKDPFRLSGDSTTYRLEESPHMTIVLQDATERHKEVLLRLDKRALLLSENNNDEDQEPTSQLQEMALASLDNNDDGNKVHPVYLLMRSSATEEHETVHYYERPSTENMKRSRKATLRLLLVGWILIVPTFFIMFVLALLSFFLLERVFISLFLWEMGILLVFLITHTSLVKLIAVYQGIHYMITSSRVVIVETLPMKMGYTLYWITHDKISHVWQGSLNEEVATNHVTLEDRKEGQLLADIKTTKDDSINGVLFEYCTDVRSASDYIEQRQTHSRSSFSIE